MRVLFIFFISCQWLQGQNAAKNLVVNPPMAYWPSKGATTFKYQCWVEHDTLMFSKTNLKYPLSLYKVHLSEIDVEKLSLQISVDTSKTNFNKRIYIVWADQKNGRDNWDVFLIYSDDEGEHWIDPILVTYHPNHKSQYSPSLNINQNNGELFLCYFDQQNYLKEDGRDIYLVKSKNGGKSFEYYRLNAEKLSSDALKKNILVFKKNGSNLFWRNIHSLNQVVIGEVLNELEPFTPDSLLDDVEINRSFLFSEKLRLNFVSKKKMQIAFAITKPIEPAFGTKIVTTQKVKKGDNQISIDMKKLKLAKDNYILTLYFNGLNKFVWITSD